MYQNEVLNQMSTKLPKFSIRELKIKYISHTKGYYGQKSLNKNFRKKGMQEDSFAKNKNSKAQKVQNDMAMRNK